MGQKQVADLDEKDLNTYPVWTSGAVIEPWKGTGNAPILSIVRSTFFAYGGQTYSGFAVLTQIKLVMPVIFAQGKQLHLFRGSQQLSREELSAAYSVLESSVDLFFPVLVRCTLSPDFEAMTTLYDGFVYYTANSEFATIK